MQGLLTGTGAAPVLTVRTGGSKACPSLCNAQCAAAAFAGYGSSQQFLAAWLKINTCTRAHVRMCGLLDWPVSRTGGLGTPALIGGMP